MQPKLRMKGTCPQAKAHSPSLQGGPGCWMPWERCFDHRCLLMARSLEAKCRNSAHGGRSVSEPGNGNNYLKQWVNQPKGSRKNEQGNKQRRAAKVNVRSCYHILKDFQSWWGRTGEDCWGSLLSWLIFPGFGRINPIPGLFCATQIRFLNLYYLSLANGRYLGSLRDRNLEQSSLPRSSSVATYRPLWVPNHSECHSNITRLPPNLPLQPNLIFLKGKLKDPSSILNFAL